MSCLPGPAASHRLAGNAQPICLRMSCPHNANSDRFMFLCMSVLCRTPHPIRVQKGLSLFSRTLPALSHNAAPFAATSWKSVFGGPRSAHISAGVVPAAVLRPFPLNGIAGDRRHSAIPKVKQVLPDNDRVKMTFPNAAPAASSRDGNNGLPRLPPEYEYGVECSCPSRRDDDHLSGVQKSPHSQPARRVIARRPGCHQPKR